MGVNLTSQYAAQQAQPTGKDCFHWDNAVRGFGLKVTSGGQKVFVLQYRTGSGNGQSRRVTIGKLGSPWTVDTARKEAKRLLGILASGGDPFEASKAQKAALDSTVPPHLIFCTVGADFIRRHAQPKNRSWKESERILIKEVYPSWGDRNIQSITRGDVARLLDGLIDRGVTTTANRVLAVVRKLFNWALARDLIDRNPAAGMEKPAPENSRDRVLSDDELRVVWKAAGALGYPGSNIVRLLILTLQRRDEVTGMRWPEFSDDWSTWTIPANRAKNNKAHLVHLTAMAQGYVRDVPRMGEHLFTSTGVTAFSGFAKMKARLDQFIQGIRIQEAREAGLDPSRVREMPHWTLHDLRRTGTTKLADLGVPPHVADKILNHSTGVVQGVAAVYNRAEYLSERREALEAWSRRVAELVGERMPIPAAAN